MAQNYEDRVTLAAFNAAAEGRGNVELVWGSYVGDGRYGNTTPSILSFTKPPLYVLIMPWGPDYDERLEVYRGQTLAKMQYNNSTVNVAVGWGNIFLTWTATENAAVQMNREGKTYNYIALLGL